jgi:GntR family transcriptional repressor for pyruvate dehydrogenase complex
MGWWGEGAVMIADDALKPVVSTRAYIQIANRVADAIRQGHFRIGDKLPPERVLTERLNVSRASVREALSALEIIGLVESRTGDGTYIRRHPDEIPLLNSMFEELAEREESPRDVLEARSVVEPASARFAAERASPEQLQRIQAALTAMGEAIAAGRSHVPHDIDFHLGVAAASGNAALARNVSLLVTVMHNKLWDHLNTQVHRTPGQVEQLLDEHQRIYEAIRAQDAKAAAEAMAAHLAESTRLFFTE